MCRGNKFIKKSSNLLIFNIKGHLGALCEGCDIYGRFWNENYGHSDAYSCGKCNETYNYIYLFLSMFLYNLIMLYSSV